MKSESTIAGAISMNSSAILKGKRAVVFGAGGSIGAAVAKEFAAEGAEVFLAGRTKANVDAVAAQITSAGGRVHTQRRDPSGDVHGRIAAAHLRHIGNTGGSRSGLSWPATLDALISFRIA